MCLSRITKFLITAYCMAVLNSITCSAQATNTSSGASYLSFEVPGALGTYPMSINNSGAVTGYYYISSTVARGFLRQIDGTMTTFDVWGGLWTEPESINSAGDITGFFEVMPGVPRGFLRSADGRITTFNPPCSFICNTSQPVEMNDYGEIAGSYPYLAAYAPAGFTRSKAREFATIALGRGAAYGTVATGINASGTTVGFYTQYPTTVTSFLQNRSGSTGDFFVPVNGGNDGGTGSEATIAESINSGGVIAGWYTACIDPCVTTTTGGFVRSPQGVFTLFTPPGTLVTLPRPGFLALSVGAGYVINAESLSAPRRLSINESGSITGSYIDTEGAQHGFVRNPYGTITSFDPPRGGRTTATGINDSDVIVGSYFHDWNAQAA